MRESSWCCCAREEKSWGSALSWPRRRRGGGRRSRGARGTGRRAPARGGVGLGVKGVTRVAVEQQEVAGAGPEWWAALTVPAAVKQRGRQEEEAGLLCKFRKD